MVASRRRGEERKSTKLVPMELPGVEVVLASTSPRRRELLARAGVAARVIDPGIDDAELHMGAVPLGQWVASLAYLKARAGVTALRRLGAIKPGTIVIGADTLVEQDGEVLSKPVDAADAERMLRLMEGREHDVLTGVALVHAASGERDVFVDKAVVSVGALGDARVREYLAGDGWRGKSGAYNLEDRIAAGWPVSAQGDPATVTGLPVIKLLPRLKAFAERVGARGVGGAA